MRVFAIAACGACALANWPKARTRVSQILMTVRPARMRTERVQILSELARPARDKIGHRGGGWHGRRQSASRRIHAARSPETRRALPRGRSVTAVRIVAVSLHAVHG